MGIPQSSLSHRVGKRDECFGIPADDAVYPAGRSESDDGQDAADASGCVIGTSIVSDGQKDIKSEDGTVGRFFAGGLSVAYYDEQMGAGRKPRTCFHFICNVF